LIAEEFDLPNEFARYEKFIQGDFERFFPVFKSYELQGNTFFQSIVNASDDLANSTKIPDNFRTSYNQIAMLGYFLLSQYSKVLTFPIPEDNFDTVYFRFKAAKFQGEKAIVSALTASSLGMLADLKKRDPMVHKAFSTIMSLELASTNYDLPMVQKYAYQFKEMLFDTVLIEEYPLLTLQIVSDLAYRDFRTGDASFSGWLDIYKELAEALNMDTKRLDCYTMLGGYYRYKGFFEDAYEYFEKAIDLAERIGNKEYIASLISNMADLEHTQGNLERALELCKETLKDPEISESKPSIYINIAEVLIKKEDYESAIEYLEKANLLTNEQSPIVNLLYGYCLTKIQGEKNYNEGIKYLEKGGHLSEKTKNQRWLAVYHFLKGRVYLDSYDLSSAIESFEKCYSIAMISEFQYSLLSQLYLAETYLHRYKISQLDSDLNNSEKFLANVIIICQEQELPILADVLYISGQILIALNELVDAEFLFQQSRDLAEQTNNNYLALKCDKSINMIKNNSVEKPMVIISEITDIINDLSTISYLKKTECIPKTYFISVFTNEGVNIYTRKFDDEQPIDEVIVSGLVSAIRTISSEFFGSGLRGIDFEGKKLLVESYDEFCGIIACDRDSFNARTKLIDFVKRFSQKFEDIKDTMNEVEILEIMQKEADLMTEYIFEKSLICD